MNPTSRITFEQFLGTLLYSSVITHVLHLQTHKYSAHMALNDFYTEVPDIVDSIIESTLSNIELSNSYENLINPDAFSNPQDYLTTLREFIVYNRPLFYDQEKSSNVWSTFDDMLNLIDSTKYKLTNLTEGLDSSDLKVSRVQKEFIAGTLMHNNNNVREFFEKHQIELSTSIEEHLKREYRCVKRTYAAIFYSRVKKDFIVVFETYRPQFYVMAALPMIDLYKPQILNSKYFPAAEYNGIIEEVQKLSKSYIPIFIKK